MRLKGYGLAIGTFALLLVVFCSDVLNPKKFVRKASPAVEINTYSVPLTKAQTQPVANKNYAFPSTDTCQSSKFLVVTADSRRLCEVAEEKAWGLAREMIDRKAGTWPIDEHAMKTVYCAMNKAYLRRHNVSLRVVDYNDPHNGLPDLSDIHFSWRKLWVLEKALETVEPGGLILWLDSDAIFRQHAVSLCEFFARLSPYDVVGNGSLETLATKSFFFGTTADPLYYHVSSHYHELEDNNNLDEVFKPPMYNTLNAGIFWLRNTDASRALLKAWKAQCEPASQASCLKEWAWEQHNLVRTLMPFRSHLAVFPGRVFQGPNGQFIRHLWDGINAKLESQYFMWTLRENQHLLPALFLSRAP